MSYNGIQLFHFNILSHRAFHLHCLSHSESLWIFLDLLLLESLAQCPVDKIIQVFPKSTDQKAMKKLAFIFLISFALVGCSFSGEVVNLDQANEINLKKAKGAELVSGAATKVKTSGKYTAAHSLGSINSQMKSKTNGGYQVFLTLQGQVAAESK